MAKCSIQNCPVMSYHAKSNRNEQKFGQKVRRRVIKRKKNTILGKLGKGRGM